jgi:hypothetical protein
VNAKGKLEEYGKEREMTFSEGNLAEPTQRTKQTNGKLIGALSGNIS